MAVTNEFQGYIWFSEKLRPPERLKTWLLQAQNRVITSWKDVPGAKVGNSIDFKLSYIAINHNSSFCARHVARVPCNLLFINNVMNFYCLNYSVPMETENSSDY